MRVVIAGAGIGGLALAQGLTLRGIEVVVLERDTDLLNTGGYTLHLRQEAVAGMRDLLSTKAVADLHARAQGRWNQYGFAVRDHHGRLITLDRSLGSIDSLDIDRITLRVLLAQGLGDALRLDSAVVGYRDLQDGRAAAVLDTGEEVEGDLVVAADGVGSAIATQLAGQPTSGPMQLIGVAGRTPEHRAPEQVREVLGRRSTLAIGPGGSGLYVGHHRLDHSGPEQPPMSPTLPSEPVYIWGVIFLDWAQTGPLHRQPGSELVTSVPRELHQRGWNSKLSALVGAADQASVSAARLHSSATYAAGLAPWSAGAVTALGDAVHAMPPTGGQGASTAIRDAHVLTQRIAEVVDGRKALRVAIGDYHSQMRGYAARAVTESLQPVSWIRATSKPVGRIAARAGLPATAAVSWAIRNGSPHTRPAL